MTRRDNRPTCAICHTVESTVRCNFHRLELCPECARNHDDHRTCYFSASVPIRLQASRQMSLNFEQNA